MRALAEPKLKQALAIRTKHERYAAIAAADKEVVDAFVKPYREAPAELPTLKAVQDREKGLRELSEVVKHTLHDLRSS